VNAALPATTIATEDSLPAQTEATQTGLPSGNVNGAGDSSATQSVTDADQSAEMLAATEVAASISSAVGLDAAANRSPVDPSQRDSASSTATSATTSAAKLAATPEPSPKIESPHTNSPAQTLAAAKEYPAQAVPAAAAPSVRNGQNNRSVAQPIAPDTISANSTAVNASLQKAISEARDKLVQAIDANLQAEIGAAPTKAISAANPANGGGGNTAGQDAGNSSFNSSAQDLLKQYGGAATGIATSASGNSNDQDALSANNSPSAVVKAAGLLGLVTDSAARVLPDPSQQAVSTTTAPTSPPPVSTNSASAARPEPPTPSPLPQSLPRSLNDVAKASELYQRVGGSEMHIAMETDLLGAVDLRATMHQSALTATIGVQRADVQALLSNELPALQHALAEKNFHVEQISVLNNSVGGRAGSGGQQEAPTQHSFAPRGGYASNLAAAGAAASNTDDMRAIASASTMAHAWSDDRGRISVHV
jgi:flagellar hook-length control protein FliK